VEASRSDFVFPRKCSQSGIIKWTRLVLCSKAQSGPGKDEKTEADVPSARDPMWLQFLVVLLQRYCLYHIYHDGRGKKEKIKISFAASTTFYGHCIALHCIALQLLHDRYTQRNSVQFQLKA
jgi:hypothetical protein